jgi:CheY-like chemotaxis protein
VRKLAGLLGGHVRVTSELGAGSTFFAVLPRVYRGPSEIVSVPDVPTRVDPARRPVLVVEDNRETLFIYEKYLKSSGFQVIPAPTLKAARQALAQFRPAAVVLDVLLEGENTWELLAELKQSGATRDIPVLVVTLVENEAKARALGADAFCIKPVDRVWLLDRLVTAAPPGAPQKILLIDDDEASRYLLRGSLAGTCYSVIEAADAGEGLRRSRQEQPSAIFLDLELPDGSGLEVLASLRAEPATRTIPVIINTSKVLGQGDRRRLTDAGAAAVISKETASYAERFARVRQALREAGLTIGEPA